MPEMMLASYQETQARPILSTDDWCICTLPPVNKVSRGKWAETNDTETLVWFYPE